MTFDRSSVDSPTQPELAGTLPDVLIVLRTLLGVFLAIVAAAVAVPMFVVADLSGGGSGWGLCPEGLGSCSTSYFAGPELLVSLLIVLLLAGGGAALCVRAIRRHGVRQ